MAAGLFIFHSSFSQTLDSLFYKDGFKRAVKILYVGKQITYTVPPDASQWQVSKDKINYIKYANGAIYSFDKPKTISDTKQDDSDFIKDVHPYILVSAGACTPSLNGYGSNSYIIVDDATGNVTLNDAGYAQNGHVFSLTAGVVLYHGWEMSVMFNTIQNGLDVSGFMNYTAAMVIGTRNPQSSAGSPTFMPISNVNASGTDYYNNYSILYGVSKNWEGKELVFGISLMAGAFITNIPAMQGIATYNTYDQYDRIISSTNYYLNTNSSAQTNFDFELSMHLDIKLSPHFFLRGLMEFQNSSYNADGSYQLMDMNTGSIFKSGGYYGKSLDIAIFNFTGGLGYKF